MKSAIIISCLVLVLVPPMVYADSDAPDSGVESRSNLNQRPSLQLSIGPIVGIGGVTAVGEDVDERTSFKAGNSFGLMAGFEPTPSLLLQLELLSVEKGAGAKTDDRTFNASYISGILLGGVSFITRGSLRPYVQGGIELGYLREAILYRDTEPPREFTEFFTRLDVGAVAALGVAWEPISRHIFTFDTRLDLGLRSRLSGVDDRNAALFFTLGFRYAVLGGSRVSSRVGTGRIAEHDDMPDSSDGTGTKAPGATGVPADTKNGDVDGDIDGDGILDGSDKCPKQAESYNGIDDEDGCPEPDGDADGIPDVMDKCPSVAEQPNDFKDTDGCPDQAIIDLSQAKCIAADYDGGKLTDKADIAKLDALAEQLKNHTDVNIVIIGYPYYNASKRRPKMSKLTKSAAGRAAAVRAYLVTDKKVEPTQVAAKPSPELEQGKLTPEQLLKRSSCVTVEIR